MFDRDGYPTKATLNKIRNWKVKDINGLLDFIAKAWKYQDWGVCFTLNKEEAKILFAEKGERYLRLATGGWSGNESLIKAFKENKNYLWMFTWQLSARGGLFIFKYYIAPKKGK